MKLPIALPALADEPGFSLLARNARVNASETTQEFCSAVGLSKAEVCAGSPSALSRLTELTGSHPGWLEQNSPIAPGRKFTCLTGHTFLSRSLRKAKQHICPVCWQNDLRNSRSQLHVRRQWLPKPIHTCIEHSSALIQLPFIDYTSCYNHILRAEQDIRWLPQLEQFQRGQEPTTFEVAAIQSLNSNQPICYWLGEPQIDVIERWSVGLGMFLQNRKGRPEELAIEDRRQLGAIGYDVTVQGRAKLDVEIDAALTRYQIRLSSTWVQAWASQSANSPERTVFRELMRDICSNQGRYSLVNVSKVSSDEHLVSCEIADIARVSNRSKAWVRKALRRQRLLPTTGIPQSRCLPLHMKRCRDYIIAAANSLDATNSAERLNIGIKGFEALFRGRVVRRMRNRSHKRSRFVASELDRILDLLARNVHVVSNHDDSSNADFVTLSDACFLYQLSTGQLARLLFAGLLPSSIQVAGIPGFLGVRLKRDEIMSARMAFTDDQIAPRALSQHLGLNFDELRALRELHLLPYFPAPAGHGYRSKKSVGKTVLTRFLKTYQTVATAARHLDIDEKVLRSKIDELGILPAKEGSGLPIYYRSDLLD